MSDDGKTLQGVPEPDTETTVTTGNNPIAPARREANGEGETRSNNPVAPRPKPAPSADEK